MIRALCILTSAVASGSALAGVYLGAITLFGVALAIAVAAGVVADLFGVQTRLHHHNERKHYVRQQL